MHRPISANVMDRTSEMGARMTVPYYYRSIDYDKLVRDYPPSRDYAESVFLFERKQIEEVQNRRFLEIVEWAWRNPFYQKTWQQHGVRREAIRSKDDLTKLPMVAVEDFKDSIKTHPPFGEHPGLAAVAQQAGLDLRRLGTRFIATFLGPDLDGSLRKMMEGAWHCPVFDNYGTHEVGLPAFECQEKDGLHLMEDMFIIEVADVDTDAILPDGEKGNLVITSLYRHHPPLIRYNLRDYIRIVSDGQRRCGCGSYTRRMDHFLGRSDDMVKIRGTRTPVTPPRACRSCRRPGSATRLPSSCAGCRRDRARGTWR